MTVHVPLEIIYSAWMYERVVHLHLQHRRLVLGFSQARMNICRPYRIVSDVYPQDCSDGNEQQGTLQLLIHMDRHSWLSGPPAGLRSDAVRHIVAGRGRLVTDLTCPSTGLGPSAIYVPMPFIKTFSTSSEEGWAILQYASTRVTRSLPFGFQPRGRGHRHALRYGLRHNRWWLRDSADAY